MQTLELDKTWKTGVGDADSYGTATIRVVVVPPKENDDQALAFIDPEEPDLDSGAGPLDSYLERKRGEGYVVFLVHGQRHDHLDESFVQRELGFKYLRTRTMIVVDVDGLAAEAIGELVQGSRQGFYRGSVYFAIVDRIVTVLKKDPDLCRLEADAEQQIAELRAGDEAVRRKLDLLIEGHHAAATRSLPGDSTKGAHGGMHGQSSLEFNERDVVVHADATVGEPADGPVIIAEPANEMIRLYPGEERTINIHALPKEDWHLLESREFKIVPAVPELAVGVTDTSDGMLIKLKFSDESIEAEDYPITTKLVVAVTFAGKPEPRLLERAITIRRKNPPPPPPPPPTLSIDPTYIKLLSRQPVKLIPGGPSLHVRLRWDGEDDLTSGWPATWTFEGQCLSLTTYPRPIFTKARYGNFEMLLDTPHGLITGQLLQFRVTAKGPNNRELALEFNGEVMEPAPEQEARKTHDAAPPAASQRRPPYELREVKREDWASPTCWQGAQWTKVDAGCFDEPNGSSPLILIINRDAEVLQQAREQMLARQLDEKTIADRIERYVAHVYFHLYKMFEYAREANRRHADDDTVRVPDDLELRGEINRVAETLSALMER